MQAALAIDELNVNQKREERMPGLVWYGCAHEGCRLLICSTCAYLGWMRRLRAEAECHLCRRAIFMDHDGQRRQQRRQTAYRRLALK